MNIILKWIIAALAVMAVAYLVPGISVDGFLPAFLVALVLGIFNVTIKPIIKIITLPLSVLTFGLFSLFINGVFFYLASLFVKGFSVAGFWPAFWGSIVVSVIVYVGDKILLNEDKDKDDIL